MVLNPYPKITAFITVYFRYKPSTAAVSTDDPTPDYMNLLGMIFSMCGLMMKVSGARQRKPARNDLRYDPQHVWSYDEDHIM